MTWCGEMLESLKQRVYEANLLLPKYQLITLTWGNVSEIDRDSGLVAIKPSGVDYDHFKPEDVVLVDLDGKVIEGKLNPSTDTPTHIELYKAFPNIRCENPSYRSVRRTQIIFTALFLVSDR